MEGLFPLVCFHMLFDDAVHPDFTFPANSLHDLTIPPWYLEQSLVADLLFDPQNATALSHVTTPTSSTPLSFMPKLYPRAP